MFRPAATLVVMLVGLAPCGAQPPQESVVQVLGNPGCGSLSQGSGVVIAPGVVATNAHVVQGSERVSVRWNGQSLLASAHILAPDLDLCLLKVPGLRAAPAQVAAHPASVAGSPLRAVGFPGGAGPIASEGSLAATWAFRASAIFQVSVPVAHGASGGGLFDAEDRLVGLTTFGFLTHEQTCFAVPATWALALLDQPWREGVSLPICRPRETLLFDFLEHMTEDPSNRAPWEAFVRAWINQRPKDPDAWFGLGHVLWAQVQAAVERSGSAPDPELLGSAVQAYRKALELSPGHARAWNNLGASYDAMGAFPEALAAYRMALRLAPDYGLAWLNLGGTHINLNQPAEAQAALRKALTLLPDEAPGWARLGYCEGILGRWREAAEAYRTALRLRPMRLDAWRDLAAALLRAGDSAGLDRLFEDLERRFPGRSTEVQRGLPRLEKDPPGGTDPRPTRARPKTSR